MTFYLAIDAATVETGCLSVLPSSHLNGVHNRLELDGSVDACGHLTPEQTAGVLAVSEPPVALELEAGEMVLLSNYIVQCVASPTHASTRNADTWPDRRLALPGDLTAVALLLAACRSSHPSASDWQLLWIPQRGDSRRRSAGPPRAQRLHDGWRDAPSGRRAPRRHDTLRQR